MIFSRTYESVWALRREDKRPIASIGVDGWAVDYVRLNRDGIPIGEPFCYRDERTLASEAEIKETCPADFSMARPACSHFASTLCINSSQTDMPAFRRTIVG